MKMTTKREMSAILDGAKRLLGGVFAVRVIIIRTWLGSETERVFKSKQMRNTKCVEEHTLNSN